MKYYLMSVFCNFCVHVYLTDCTLNRCIILWFSALFRKLSVVRFGLMLRTLSRPFCRTACLKASVRHHISLCQICWASASRLQSYRNGLPFSVIVLYIALFIYITPTYIWEISFSDIYFDSSQSPFVTSMSKWLSLY